VVTTQLPFLSRRQMEYADCACMVQQHKPSTAAAAPFSVLSIGAVHQPPAAIRKLVSARCGMSFGWHALHYDPCSYCRIKMRCHFIHVTAIAKSSFLRSSRSMAPSSAIFSHRFRKDDLRLFIQQSKKTRALSIVQNVADHNNATIIKTMNGAS